MHIPCRGANPSKLASARNCKNFSIFAHFYTYYNTFQLQNGNFHNKILKFSNTWQPCTCFTWHQLWLAEQEDDLPVVIMEYFNAPQKGLSTSITVVFGELLNILLPGHAGCNYITDHRQITSYNHKTIGHVVALAAITGTTIKYPIWKSSHSNSFDDWAPVDEIYVYPFFKGVAETWLHDGVPGW